MPFARARLPPPCPQDGSAGEGSEGARLELYLRRLLGRGTVFAEVEERLRVEAERGRKQHCREVLDAGVELLHGVVEEAPRRCELVLDIGQLRLQLLEVLVRLQVRIGLREREQLPQR